MFNNIDQIKLRDKNIFKKLKIKFMDRKININQNKF